VIVDLAADSGGNVEGALPDQRVDKHGVTIIGASKLARSLAADSSALFARNLFNFLSAFWDKDKNSPELADEDEIVAAIRLTKDGKVVSDRLAGA
jgi:NAD(P) transhydrogenase subunit alpha